MVLDNASEILKSQNRTQLTTLALAQTREESNGNHIIVERKVPPVKRRLEQ